MKHWVGCVVIASVIAGVAGAQERPKITGISNMGIYTTDGAATEQFFVHDLGAFKAADPQNSKGMRYYFSKVQFVEVLPMPAGDTSVNRMDHAGYTTTDAEGMRKYLGAHGVKVPAAVNKGSDGSEYFDVTDPEGNTVQFVQAPKHPMQVPPNPLSDHMIHVGMMVHNSAVEDSFYRKVLGFRPYWHGGRDDETDWISLQVPDGQDWLEYMMVKGPETRGIPATVSQQSLGSMDHFSLGVQNMEKTADVLYAEDRFSPRHSPMQMGRDGKWQLNLYAPDDTRVEYMEFQPSIKPCCSPMLLPSPTK